MSSDNIRNGRQDTGKVVHNGISHRNLLFPEYVRKSSEGYGVDQSSDGNPDEGKKDEGEDPNFKKVLKGKD